MLVDRHAGHLVGYVLRAPLYRLTLEEFGKGAGVEVIGVLAAVVNQRRPGGAARRLLLLTERGLQRIRRVLALRMPGAQALQPIVKDRQAVDVSAHRAERMPVGIVAVVPVRELDAQFVSGVRAAHEFVLADAEQAQKADQRWHGGLAYANARDRRRLDHG